MPLHSTEKTVKNTLVYTAATVAQKAISFVYFFILSSNLPPSLLGAYTGMLALASLAAIGTDLGLTPLLTREAAKDEGEAVALLRAVWMIKIPLVALTLATLWIAAPLLLPLTATELLLLVGGSLIISLDAFTAGAYAVLRARQNVFVESRAIIIFQITVFVCGTAALYLTRNILFIMAALVIGSAVNATYTIISLRQLTRQRMTPRFDRPRIKKLLAAVPAFASAGIFTKIYQQADVVLLRALTNSFAVGLYAVPAKITTALQTLIPGAFSAAVYPTMSNFAHHDRPRLQKLFSNTFGILLMLSLPIALILALLTPELLLLIWPQYVLISSAMRLMLLAVPFLFLPYATSSLLNAVGRERRNSMNRGIMTAANVGLNVLLIPLFGVLGAAIAFFTANVCLLGLDLWGLRREVKIWNADTRRFVVGSFAAAAVTAMLGLGILVAVNPPNRSWQLFAYLAATGVFCSLAYAALVFAFRVVRREDLITLKEMVGRR